MGRGWGGGGWGVGDPARPFVQVKRTVCAPDHQRVLWRWREAMERGGRGRGGALDRTPRAWRVPRRALWELPSA